MITSESLPEVYISIGSNVEPELNLQAAVRRLRKRCNVLAISSVYQSPAYGFADQPDFLDIVVKLSTPLFPASFKEVLYGIERQAGRDRASQVSKDGPLPLDIDILLWGKFAFTYGSKPWRVPDANILRYAAVAVPLAELAPEFVHPDESVTLAEIAARFDSSEVRRVDVLIE